MASLNQEVLRRVQFLLAPVPEQRAIAAALSDVDALIEALDAAVAKKRAMKLAAMQQLLTGKTRLPGFDGEWTSRRVASMLSFLPTANNPRKDLSGEGDLGYIHYGDVHAHAMPILDCTKCSLPRISRSRVGNAVELQDGDLVFVDASEDLVGVGKSVEVANLNRQPVVAGLHTIACRGSTECWAPGFKAYLQFIPAFKRALERVATGISVYAISKRQIADVELALPDVCEQAEIVTILSDMDAEIATLEHRCEKTKAIKQGMMQALLTGRVRLVEPEAV
jgi:type I restriction enzyme, S subunit